MRDAYRRSPLPSGRNDTIEPEYRELGVQWSQVAVTPIRKRPSGLITIRLFSPPATGPSRILLCCVKCCPSKPPYASTRPTEATYRRPPYHARPRGSSRPETTSIGLAPGLAIT